MNLILDKILGNNYSSKAQKIRVISESWTQKNIFCPNCGSNIINLENNKKVSDFLCEKCLENYEQKASQKKFQGKVVSSAYKTIVARLSSMDKPHFFFLHYLIKNYFVNDFFVVPKYFFIPEIIEKRKALKKTAKRAGWVGSYILFSKKEVLEKWQKTAFLKDVKKDELRGWILDIMNCIDALNKKEFTLQEMYNFEPDLKMIHPENKHIKDKIRQQLQFLRDKGYVSFVGSGKYNLN